MVKHSKGTKTSSKVSGIRKTDYQFPCSIDMESITLPATINTVVGPDSDSVLRPFQISDTSNPNRYVISGTFNEDAEEIVWRDAPHIALANLRVEDSHSAMNFVRRYGIPSEAQVQRDDTGVPQSFTIDSASLHVDQDDLRRAWEGDAAAVADMEARVEEDFDADVVVSYGSVTIRPKDLASLISLMFLRDYTAGKLGVCANPDCPAPYFKKNRKTQKICEKGPCVQYAQRQYSLKWWNKKGGGNDRRRARHSN